VDFAVAIQLTSFQVLSNAGDGADAT